MSAFTVILTVATALLFLAAARVKFIGERHAMETRDRLGISPARYRFIGVLEVAGAVGAIVGLWVTPLGIAALAGLLLVAIGACGTQIRLHNPASEARPAVVALLLTAGALALQIITL